MKTVVEVLALAVTVVTLRQLLEIAGDYARRSNWEAEQGRFTRSPRPAVGAPVSPTRESEQTLV